METCQENQKIRHDWYQTESHVVVNILCKNVKDTDFSAKYESNSLAVSFSTEQGKHNMNFTLLHEINPLECSYKITSSKIEIKLKKKEGFRWAKLEYDESLLKNVKEAMSSVQYPSSSLKQKNWDKVIVDITKNDDDNPEGDEALNSLFQKIYSEGSDEVKKAMNKSFVESAGTVLSTNWGEVKKETVSVKPPDGMEFKKWNS